MTDRQKFREDINRMARASKDVEKDVVDHVKKEYVLVLEQAKEKTTDIGVVTRHMLDDVEAGLSEAGHESAEILAKAADGIVDVTRDITQQSLEAVRSYADSAKAVLNKALDKSGGVIEEIEDATKQEMKDAHSKLYQQTRHMLEQTEVVGKAVYEYSAEKAGDLGEAAAPRLKEAAEKSRTYAKEAEEQAAAYSKQLLHHSQETASKWLRKLADMVKPDEPDKG